MTGEKIIVGMLLSNNDVFSFHESENKKSVAKRLFPETWDSADMALKHIKNTITRHNTIEPSSSTEFLFPIPKKIDFSYFEYLSKYANGIVQFSPAVHIYDTLDNEKILKLFTLLVDRNETYEVFTYIDTLKEFTFIENVQNKLISRVQERVHTNVKIDNNILPSILSPVDLNCIGKNGVFVGAKSLPIVHTKQTIKSNVEAYINVIVHLSIKYQVDIKKNKFYLISDEPSNINSPEHGVWEKLQKEETLFTVIPSEDADIVATKIEESHATKFLALQTS